MSKKYIKILFIFLSLFLMIGRVNADSLKQLKEKLAKDEANKAALIAQQRQVEDRIRAANSDVSAITKKIADNENKIEESKDKIEELKKDIESKQKEIDNLLSFMQLSKKDNVYLEYVFEAKTFTDFIYRSAIVEELTKYNDELIDYMYKIIEQNKSLQKKLERQIKEAEANIDELEVKLKKYDLNLDSIADEQVDVEADIKARKVMIASYEKIYKQNKCKEDVDISRCVKVPPTNKFVRPLVKGSVTSTFGTRYHPIYHVWRLHTGIDIGGNYTGTKVYAAASGRVSKITRKSSCGGNMVYIEHNLRGSQYRTLYMHLHTINVKVGQTVDIYTQVGTVGGGESYDGCSTGPHLHLTVLKGWSGNTYLNPANYFAIRNSVGYRFSSRW